MTSCSFRRIIYRQDRSTRCHNPETRNRNPHLRNTVLHFKHSHIIYFFPRNLCSTSNALLYCEYSTNANMAFHSSLIYNTFAVGLCQEVHTCTPYIHLHGVVHWNPRTSGSDIESRPGYRQVTQQKRMSEWCTIPVRSYI
jgi:hypothetical protein